MTLRLHSKTLTLLILSATFAAASFVVYWATDRHIEESRMARAGLEQEIATLQSHIDASASIARSIRESGGDQEVITSHFLDEASVVPFINAVERAGNPLKTDVSVVSVNAGTEAPFVDLSLTVTGRFDPVLRTIQAIEALPYAMSLRSGTLERAPEGVGADAWRASLTYRALKQP